ncbi:hypothetical protein D3C71_1809360 [compost metagenome]
MHLGFGVQRQTGRSLCFDNVPALFKHDVLAREDLFQGQVRAEIDGHDQPDSAFGFIDGGGIEEGAEPFDFASLFLKVGRRRVEDRILIARGHGDCPMVAIGLENAYFTGV